ncbi:hypothetical protein IVB14_12935 [Bradyrhizobium sp. 180]|uniref:hypothetical protein n=1 Tax=Bradyrhizobium sp. 180 TaxID=2782650 RepID=UPI001FF9E7BC|nr:hypothetical protein [Bradyrhizobium sp. 180]MCK1491296.1 hypothetical protein [Bradyrhizobium sp. 180]
MLKHKYDKTPTEAERIELIRNGKTVCIVCGDVMDAFGGGKTRKKYCSMKCKDRNRRRNINADARAMGRECHRIWLALPKGEARDQYVDWIMFLGTTGWRYAYMFRYRWSPAREVIVHHFGEFDEGPEALRAYLERPTVKRWRVPRASIGIKAKRSAYGRELHNRDEDFQRFAEALEREYRSRNT